MLQCCWIRENKSLTATVDVWCKSSYFEVEVLMDEFPLIREINSVVEGKRRSLLVDFVKS